MSGPPLPPSLPPRHSDPLWPLHVWLRKTISSDIIDVTDVIVIKLSACEGPLCHRAAWWIIGKVGACNAQVSASRTSGLAHTYWLRLKGLCSAVEETMVDMAGEGSLPSQLYLLHLEVVEIYLPCYSEKRGTVMSLDHGRSIYSSHEVTTQAALHLCLWNICFCLQVLFFSENIKLMQSFLFIYYSYICLLLWLLVQFE